MTMAIVKLDDDVEIAREETPETDLVPLYPTAPARMSCGCDGALDDGCYNCSDDWRCSTCGWPLALALNSTGYSRLCPRCAGFKLSDEQWERIMHSGRLP